MLNNKQLSFRKVKSHDYDLICNWLNKPHIRPYFFGIGLENTIKNLRLSVQGINSNGHYTFEHWLALAGNQAFGFLITSRIDGPFDKDDPYNKWYNEGEEIFTLDLLIGEEGYLSKGFGVKMIQDFLSNKFLQANKILIDPAAENTRAIHVYEKVGFKKIEIFYPSYDPTPHWMMVLELNKSI